MTEATGGSDLPAALPGSLKRIAPMLSTPTTNCRTYGPLLVGCEAAVAVRE